MYLNWGNHKSQYKKKIELHRHDVGNRKQSNQLNVFQTSLSSPISAYSLFQDIYFSIKYSSNPRMKLTE